jgi:hypothetical protein
VATQLFSGEALPAGVRARLPPRANGLLAAGMKDPALWQVLVLRDGWRSARGALDRAIAAADLPDPEREAAFDGIAAELARRVNFAPSIALPLSGYLKYARRADDARRGLDALAVAAEARAFRSAHGRWPAALAELGGPGAAAGPVRLGAVTPSAALPVEVALLSSGPDAPERFTLEVRPPPGGAAGSRAARPRAAPPP